ncbi:MAG: DeoR family transcriptional regulator [Candidatus Bathyarchaeota archaeon]|nr:MAG: DeoR family transcriptional regulator [Candidatus Bathyarchaeota archaeon]
MSEETKKEKNEETKKPARKEEIEDFEVLAEWTVRRLRPLQDVSDEDYPEKVKRWVIYSLGLDRLHQDIFLYLEKNFRSTTTDIASEFDISPNTARKYLDELHTVGLVDYIGREYTLTYESLSRAIELMLIPRITDTLRTIAKGASNTDKSFSTSFPASEDQEVIVESGVTLINKKLLDSWYNQGKKVRVKSYSGLTVKDDVDPDLFDAVITHLKCMGGLRIPTEVYTRVAHKIRCIGGVDTY